jgi:DNA-binding CsgD family transcriptional regulator
MHASGERVTLSDVRRAYLDGEYGTCLLLCDQVASQDRDVRFEIAVLRARIHVRVDRGERALEALRNVASETLSVDQLVVAQMLHGAAYVRLGQKERGAALLREAMEKARDAHATVRAEVALQLGIALFRLGSYAEADSLLASVDSNQDVVHAHALEYRGWVAHARGEFAKAAQWFRETLRALMSCRRRDRYVEAKALYGLTAMCPELLSVEDWSRIEQRVRRFDWTLDGLAPWRFWIYMGSSFMCEMAGDIDGSRRWARRAETIAGTDGHRVGALCRIAAVFRGLGQAEAHAEFVERAQAVYETLELRTLSPELQHLPLYLAEEISHTEAGDVAESLLAQYHDVVLSALKSSSADLEQHSGMECYLEGLLRLKQGDLRQAVRCFTSAYRTFVRRDYRRRATMVALHLARLTGQPRYALYAEKALRETSPDFWMTRELNEIRRGTGPALTETEAAILRLIAHGRTYKEIAASRNVSVKTVGNHVAALFRKFDVHSRGELASEAYRQHIVAPDRSSRKTDRIA